MKNTEKCAKNSMRRTLKNSKVGIPDEDIEKMLNFDTRYSGADLYATDCDPIVYDYEQKLYSLDGKIPLLDTLTMFLTISTIQGLLPLENIVGLELQEGETL